MGYPTANTTALGSEIKAWPSLRAVRPTGRKLSQAFLLFPVNTIDGAIFYGVIDVRFRIDRKFNDFDITGII
jgi:hypothetical protein